MPKATSLLSPTGKSQTLRPVLPNVGLAVAYQRKLDAAIEEMARSLEWWLSAAYKRAEPATMAQDASAAVELSTVMRRLARRWLKRFDDLANEMGQWFATSVSERADASLKTSLAKGGMSVRFKMTAGQNDAVQAVLAENVGLIKSIAARHLESVQGAVMRSVAAGRDLGSLSKELQAAHGVTRRRAATIAHHQNNMATAVITRVRQQELGITQAVWRHSHGGRVPRPSHVKAGADKLVYDVSKGAFLDGAWVYPGQLIGCRCVSRAIVPGLN